MSKICKTINIALIFMLIGVFVSVDISYALRPPMQGGSIIKKQRESWAGYSKDIENYSRLKHEINLYGIAHLSESIKELKEVVEIFVVFWKIIDEITKTEAKQFDFVTKEYKDSKINLFQACDILQEKALRLKEKTLDLTRNSRGEKKKIASRIYTWSLNAIELIDKYAKGKEIPLQPIDLYALLLCFKADFETLNDDEGVNLQIKCDKDIVIKGSQLEFHQIFNNLSRNAIEHGEPENIYIDVKLRDGKVEITFRDDGKGLKKDALKKDRRRGKRLFREDYTTRKKRGGRGLSIIYDIITKRWGGEIDVASESGKGTTFIMTFPLASDKAIQNDQKLLKDIKLFIQDLTLFINETEAEKVSVEILETKQATAQRLMNSLNQASLPTKIRKRLRKELKTLSSLIISLSRLIKGKDIEIEKIHSILDEHKKELQASPSLDTMQKESFISSATKAEDLALARTARGRERDVTTWFVVMKNKISKINVTIAQFQNEPQTTSRIPEIIEKFLTILRHKI